MNQRPVQTFAIRIGRSSAYSGALWRGLLGFVHTADVRVIQSSLRLGLSEEADFQFFIFRRPKKLQGNDSFELGVLGLVNDTHATFA